MTQLSPFFTLAPTLAPSFRHAPSMTTYNLTHLRQLEAESIHIIREVAAEFEKPVMLYSIGKDSACMVRLAEKAFFPAKPPFPLLHVDTTWKFLEMYDLRVNYVAKQLGLQLIVHVNQEGLSRGIGPITHGSKVHTDVMKTEGLKQALNLYKFDAAFGGARRDEHEDLALAGGDGGSESPGFEPLGDGSEQVGAALGHRTEGIE